jgi:hypothetical protein
MKRRRRIGLVLLLGGLVPASGCRAPGGPDPVAETGGVTTVFDWTLGRWAGFRRDAASGEEAPMTMTVEPILGGHGQIRRLEVHPEGGVYRGFAVQVEDDAGRWERHYVNAVRRRFALLEAAPDDAAAEQDFADSSVWRSVTPGRTRESRLLSERLAPDRWRRTMSVGEDGGKSWRVLWVDELRREDAP